MANFTFYRRKCGFGGNRSFVGKILAVNGNTAAYDRDSKCWTKLGAANVGLTGTTQWLNDNQEKMAVNALNMKQPATMIRNAATEVTKELQMDTQANSMGGFFQRATKGITSIGKTIGGVVEFGKKRLWLPFAIIAAVILILGGGFVLVTGGGRRRRRR